MMFVDDLIASCFALAWSLVEMAGWIAYTIYIYIFKYTTILRFYKDCFIMLICLFPDTVYRFHSSPYLPP